VPVLTPSAPDTPPAGRAEPRRAAGDAAPAFAN
jgi:hypothetical protein